MGLGESLIEFQIASPWGPWAQFPPGCPPEPSLVFPLGLKHLGCLAILDPPRLPPPGQWLGMDVFSEGPPLILTTYP